MSILINNAPYKSEPWQRYLREYLPDHTSWLYPDVPDPALVEYALIWDHPHGDLHRYPNLRAIMNLGAGMDLIDQHPSLPDVPIVRLIDPAVGDDMAQYAMYWIMHFQRGYEAYRQAAAERQWRRHKHKISQDYTVTVLGLGLIGAFIAERFALNNFKVIGWSRQAKTVNGVETVSGAEQLDYALSHCDTLINCLPLNAATRHFLNHERLNTMRKGSTLVNLSRGAVIDDTTLIALLKSGHIAGAALDVFVQEPLPADAEYWSLANVFVTPHVSGMTYARDASRVLAENILRIERGEQPFPIYKPN